MRWTVEMLGTDAPVLVETDELCGSYDKALEMFCLRRAHKMGKNVRVIIRLPKCPSIACDSTSPLTAFIRALNRGLDENTWNAAGGTARDEAVAALERVQHKLTWLGSTDIWPT